MPHHVCAELCSHASGNIPQRFEHCPIGVSFQRQLQDTVGDDGLQERRSARRRSLSTADRSTIVSSAHSCMAGDHSDSWRTILTVLPAAAVLVAEVALAASPSGAAAVSAASADSVAADVSSFCTRHVRLPTVMLSTQGTEGAGRCELPAAGATSSVEVRHAGQMLSTDAAAVDCMQCRSLMRTFCIAVMTGPAGKCTCAVHRVRASAALPLQ